MRDLNAEVAANLRKQLQGAIVYDVALTDDVLTITLREGAGSGLTQLVVTGDRHGVSPFVSPFNPTPRRDHEHHA